MTDLSKITGDMNQWDVTFIPIKKLKEILDKLPDGCYLAPNDVRNISIIQIHKEHNTWFEIIGFIDIRFEELELIKEVEKDDDTKT